MRPQKPPGWRWIENHVRDWRGVSAEFVHPVGRLGSPDRVAELQLPKPLLPDFRKPELAGEEVAETRPKERGLI